MIDVYERPLCQIYGEEAEIQEHLFLKCMFNQSVKGRLNIGWEWVLLLIQLLGMCIGLLVIGVKK